MSEDLRWVLAIIVAGLAGLAGVVLRHIIGDMAYREKAAKTEQKVEQLDDEVERLRDKSHQHADEINSLKARDYLRKPKD